MTDTTIKSPVKIAGIIAVVFFGIVILLQLLLALGILPVTMAWGGRQHELTTSLRLTSLGSMVLLASFSYVIARRADLIGTPPPSLLIKVSSWLITGYLGLNTLGNFTSQSSGEKWLFGPITVVLLVTCLLISSSKITSQ